MKYSSIPQGVLLNKFYLIFLKSIVPVVRCYVICPYCDPNYMAYPNLEEAMRGYDVPMGNPNPGRGNSDPGIRNQIFSPMKRNDDGHMELDIRFITANAQIKCDATWTSEVFDHFKEYVDGKTRSSTMGFGIEVGPELSINFPGQIVSGEFPSLFTRSWSQSDEIDKMKNFFKKDRGSVAVSQAICITHKVDIADMSIKKFVEPFIDSVKALHSASSKSEKIKTTELKRFINEFGTHYPSTTEMGTKLLIERRYSFSERVNADDNELKNCNTVAGSRVFGFQIEKNEVSCSKEDLQSNKLNSDYAERMIISTYGSFISKDLASWSKQVINLVQSNSFNPRAIRRELRSIIHLFDQTNFSNVTDEYGKELNMSLVLDWVLPMMTKYCSLFHLDCNQTGCGIDDDCTVQEWCVEKDASYECVHKNMSIELTEGEKYFGEVGTNFMPDGYGKKYFKNGNIEYLGNFKSGKKSGNGTLFFDNGNKAYEGEFLEGLMDGQGYMYYKNTGNIMFKGVFAKGKFSKGILYQEDGNILTQLKNSQN